MSKEIDTGIIEAMKSPANKLSNELAHHDIPPSRLDMPDIHPLKIICSPDCDGDIETGQDRNLVTEKRPGWIAITPDYGARTKGEKSVYIMLHESIPQDFKQIVYFHEVMEASTAHHMDIELKEAHNYAEELTKDFAKKRLTRRQYQRFSQWKKTRNY